MAKKQLTMDKAAIKLTQFCRELDKEIIEGQKLIVKIKRNQQLENKEFNDMLDSLDGVLSKFANLISWANAWRDVEKVERKLIDE